MAGWPILRAAKGGVTMMAAQSGGLTRGTGILHHLGQPEIVPDAWPHVECGGNATAFPGLPINLTNSICFRSESDVKAAALQRKPPNPKESTLPAWILPSSPATYEVIQRTSFRRPHMRRPHMK